VYVLLNVLVGRGDALPTKWRHRGVRTGEYPVAEVVDLVRYLEESTP
jgi:hypothetical protein